MYAEYVEKKLVCLSWDCFIALLCPQLENTYMQCCTIGFGPQKRQRNVWKKLMSPCVDSSCLSKVAKSKYECANIQPQVRLLQCHVILPPNPIKVVWKGNLAFTYLLCNLHFGIFRVFTYTLLYHCILTINFVIFTYSWLNIFNNIICCQTQQQTTRDVAVIIEIFMVWAKLVPLLWTIWLYICMFTSPSKILNH